MADKKVQRIQFLRNSGITTVTNAVEALEAKTNTIKSSDTSYDGSIILSRDKSGNTVAAIMTVNGDTVKSTVFDPIGIGKKIDSLSSTTSGSVGDLQSKINAVSGTAKANVDAITKLNGADTVDGSVKKTVKDAIEALDVTAVGGTGKVITTVSETDGKISATAIDLKAENVAFTPTSNVAGAVDVTGSTVTAAVASLAKSVNDVKTAAATYKVVKVTSGLEANVKEAYQLVQTVDGTDSNISVQIPIYKDQTLKSVELTAEDDKKKKGQFMKYTYIDANGGDVVVYVDCSKFLVESEFKNGLGVNDAGEVSVKIDTTSETFLTVGEGGVKLAGVQNAIDVAKNTVIGTASDTADKDTINGVKKAISDEATTARAAEKANADAITILKGDETVNGSVAKSVRDAKSELLGDAATDYDTLGKLEDKIQALDSKAANAHTEVKAKADGHVKVTVADSTDKTHKVVTVTESDIASATALAKEISDARAAETKITPKAGEGITVSTADSGSTISIELSGITIDCGEY